jgi:hypothetical protein
VRNGEELALRLLRDQVEQQPRRVDHAELRVGFHLGDAVATWSPRMLSSSAT